MATTAVLKAPYKDEPVDSQGALSRPWQEFFRVLQRNLDALGVEHNETLNNNQVAALDVSAFAFDESVTKHAIVEYFIQRITTGAGAVELIKGGSFHVVYLTTSLTWQLQNMTPVMPVAGITFTVTSTGKIQYTSTNELGTAKLSKVSFRIRTMVG